MNQYNYLPYRIKPLTVLFSTVFITLLAGCSEQASQSTDSSTTTSDITANAIVVESDGETSDAREKHLSNIQQLTFGGQNAEAYFAYDDSKLVFQATTRDAEKQCDQIYIMNIDGSDKKRVSTGNGVTTCAFFYPDDQHILYASTHADKNDCPPLADFSEGYTWRLEKEYDIYKADLDGKVVAKLTNEPGYDAEAVISPTGDKIVFTSVRSGDLELWTMDLDGTNLKQITDTPGYDGGAFFSPNGKKIVWRASRFDDDAEGLAEYQRLLDKGLIRPSSLDLYIMNVDGTNKQKITDFGKASFGPYFHPSGEKIIFSSNIDDPQGREFDLYLVDINTKELERVTYTGDFDGFPMFSRDGKKLVWGSNRHNEKPRETNVFIADWIE